MGRVDFTWFNRWRSNFRVDPKRSVEKREAEAAAVEMKEATNN